MRTFATPCYVLRLDFLRMYEVCCFGERKGPACFLLYTRPLAFYTVFSLSKRSVRVSICCLAFHLLLFLFLGIDVGNSSGHLMQAFDDVGVSPVNPISFTAQCSPPCGKIFELKYRNFLKTSIALGSRCGAIRRSLSSAWPFGVVMHGPAPRCDSGC